jgi:hypothetical protein
MQFLGWVQHHPMLGMLAVMVVYIVATILFVPGSILTIGAGYAFGAALHSPGTGVALASTVRLKRSCLCVFFLNFFLVIITIFFVLSFFHIPHQPFFLYYISRALNACGIQQSLFSSAPPSVRFARSYLEGIYSEIV